MHFLPVGTTGAQALKREWAKVWGEKGWWEEVGRSVQVEGASGLGHTESGC